MRLFISTLIFFCFATVSAQCTYGDIEITVTGETYKRIILTNTASGEAFQSYDTSSNYDQLPDALNSVSQWEPLSGGGPCTTTISISWVAYSIINLEVYGSANCFTVNLSSLSGGYDVQPDGSVVLFNDNALTSFTDPESPESCNNNGNVEITVTGDNYKRIILTNTATGESFQSYDTSSNYDQLPEALNWVGSWETLNGTMSTPNLDVTWDGYSILTTNTTECFLQMMYPWECCDNSSDCFEADLLSLSGEFSVQPGGSILLLTACDAPVGFCDCNGGVIDECGVCGGDNSTCTDCAGEVNGDALIQAYFFDADGDGLGYGEAVEYCSGSVPTCTDGDGVETGCWVLNDYDSYPDCYSNNVDCNGTCDGYEVVNGCGECGGDQWALWYADLDGDGLGDPNTEISSCDYIEGYVVWDNTDPDDNCFSNVIDECGVCDGGGIADGACDCDGNVLDECGVCGGGNSSCSGCTNSNATNYDSTATLDDGSCMYNQNAYDAAIAECPECINEDQIEEGFSCIEIWEPVCGCNDVTYSNECYAYYNGVTEWTDGECESLNPYNPDYDNDDIIGVNDLLALLSVFGSPFNSNAVCGNGIVEEGEDCDDGNDIPGDGCDGCMFDGIIQE